MGYWVVVKNNIFYQIYKRKDTFDIFLAVALINETFLSDMATNMNTTITNKAGYTAQDAPSTRLKITEDGPTDGRTDGPTDGRADRHTFL